MTSRSTRAPGRLFPWLQPISTPVAAARHRRSIPASPRVAVAAILLGLLCTAHPVVRGQVAPYTFYQINSGFSPAMDVNDDGTVVGWWSGPPVSPDPNTNSQGYVWTRAAGAQPIITDAPTVTKFPLYTAVNDPTRMLRINATGMTAGVGCPQGCGTSDTKAAIWSSSQGLFFLGSFDNNLQTSAAAGVNDAGQVVGYSWGGGYNNFGPFIWSSAGGFQHLTGFDGLNGYATGINKDGVVVGAKGTGTRYVAFVWSAVAGQTDIPDIPGATTSFGFSVNDAGVVVGRYTEADQTTHRVFRWSAATGTEDLTAPAGLPELLDINNSGDIVATISSPAGGGQVPYLYRNGIWTNINDLMPSGIGFTLQVVEAINNKGWIVGAGTTAPNGTELLQGFVLIPPNSAPVATDDAISTQEDTATNGTLSASDADGDPLTYSIVANGSKGTATVTNAATGAFTYTPNASENGTDTFTFKASDGTLDSNTATITVTISPVDDLCATNISSSVVVSQGSLKLNRKTGRYTRTVTMKNSDGAVAGPVSLVLDSLSANVSLFNATGTTICAAPLGSPYINLDVGTNALFSPRERATVMLEFTSSSGQAITYTARVLAGSGDR